MNNLELDYLPCEQLPPWYREVLDYQQMCNTIGAQFALLAEEITRVADNFFLQTMDLETVQMWEGIFRIVATPATESLQFRRDRIINRISMRPPFTLRFLYQKLDELIGPGLWNVTVDYPNYALYIESNVDGQGYSQELIYTINHIKPAHITFINSPVAMSGVVLSERVSEISYTWNYVLNGQWLLGQEPFADEEEVQVIKLPQTPSIQSALLTGIADFVSNDVAAARLNGSIMVENINKSVSGSTLTITYQVTQAMTTEITQVELLAADGTVLTSMSAYVPVTETAVIKHVIPVQEGIVNADT